jgi:hypothetical protein
VRVTKLKPQPSHSVAFTATGGSDFAFDVMETDGDGPQLPGPVVDVTKGNGRSRVPPGSGPPEVCGQAPLGIGWLGNMAWRMAAGGNCQA